MGEVRTMSYKDRSPDFETESLRAWIPTEEEKKDLKKNEKGFKIDLGDGFKIQLTGFNMAYERDKYNKKIPSIAWKFKHHDKSFLFFDIIKNEKSARAREFLTALCNEMGDSLISGEEITQNMKDSERHLKLLEKQQKQKKNQKRPKKNAHNRFIAQDLTPDNTKLSLKK
jgi:hypothetical protein